MMRRYINYRTACRGRSCCYLSVFLSCGAIHPDSCCQIPGGISCRIFCPNRSSLPVQIFLSKKTGMNF